MFGKHVELQKEEGSWPKVCVPAQVRTFYKLIICEHWSVMVKWSIINTNRNGDHFIKLCGETIWRTRSRSGFPSGILVFISGVHGRWWASGSGCGLVVLTLQLLLCLRGFSHWALRTGVGCGAEHLFKAASAVVCSAYFRLKPAEMKKCS